MEKMDFHSMSRKELQGLCKKHKIAANMTNSAMADALDALQRKEVDRTTEKGAVAKQQEEKPMNSHPPPAAAAAVAVRGRSTRGSKRTVEEEAEEKVNSPPFESQFDGVAEESVVTKQREEKKATSRPVAAVAARGRATRASKRVEEKEEAEEKDESAAEEAVASKQHEKNPVTSRPVAPKGRATRASKRVEEEEEPAVTKQQEEKPTTPRPAAARGRATRASKRVEPEEVAETNSKLDDAPSQQKVDVDKEEKLPTSRPATGRPTRVSRRVEEEKEAEKKEIDGIPLVEILDTPATSPTGRKAPRPRRAIAAKTVTPKWEEAVAVPTTDEPAAPTAQVVAGRRVSARAKKPTAKANDTRKDVQEELVPDEAPAEVTAAGENNLEAPAGKKHRSRNHSTAADEKNEGIELKQEKKGRARRSSRLQLAEEAAAPPVEKKKSRKKVRWLLSSEEANDEQQDTNNVEKSLSSITENDEAMEEEEPPVEENRPVVEVEPAVAGESGSPSATEIGHCGEEDSPIKGLIANVEKARIEEEEEEEEEESEAVAIEVAAQPSFLTANPLADDFAAEGSLPDVADEFSSGGEEATVNEEDEVENDDDLQEVEALADDIVSNIDVTAREDTDDDRGSMEMVETQTLDGDEKPQSNAKEEEEEEVAALELCLIEDASADDIVVDTDVTAGEATNDDGGSMEMATKNGPALEEEEEPAILGDSPIQGLITIVGKMTTAEATREEFENPPAVNLDVGGGEAEQSPDAGLPEVGGVVGSEEQAAVAAFTDGLPWNEIFAENQTLGGEAADEGTESEADLAAEFFFTACDVVADAVEAGREDEEEATTEAAAFLADAPADGFHTNTVMSDEFAEVETEEEEEEVAEAKEEVTSLSEESHAEEEEEVAEAKEEVTSSTSKDEVTSLSKEAHAEEEEVAEAKEVVTSSSSKDEVDSLSEEAHAEDEWEAREEEAATPIEAADVAADFEFDIELAGEVDMEEPEEEEVEEVTSLSEEAHAEAEWAAREEEAATPIEAANIAADFEFDIELAGEVDMVEAVEDVQEVPNATTPLVSCSPFQIHTVSQNAMAEETALTVPEQPEDFAENIVEVDIEYTEEALFLPQALFEDQINVHDGVSCSPFQILSVPKNAMAEETAEIGPELPEDFAENLVEVDIEYAEEALLLPQALFEGQIDVHVVEEDSEGTPVDKAPASYGPLLQLATPLSAAAEEESVATIDVGNNNTFLGTDVDNSGAGAEEDEKKRPEKLRVLEDMEKLSLRKLKALLREKLSAVAVTTDGSPSSAAVVDDGSKGESGSVVVVETVAVHVVTNGSPSSAVVGDEADTEVVADVAELMIFVDEKDGDGAADKVVSSGEDDVVITATPSSERDENKIEPAEFEENDEDGAADKVVSAVEEDVIITATPISKRDEKKIELGSCSVNGESRVREAPSCRQSTRKLRSAASKISSAGEDDDAITTTTSTPFSRMDAQLEMGSLNGKSRVKEAAASYSQSRSSRKLRSARGVNTYASPGGNITASRVFRAADMSVTAAATPASKRTETGFRGKSSSVAAAAKSVSNYGSRVREAAAFYSSMSVTSTTTARSFSGIINVEGSNQRAPLAALNENHLKNPQWC